MMVKNQHIAVLFFLAGPYLLGTPVTDVLNKAKGLINNERYAEAFKLLSRSKYSYSVPEEWLWKLKC